MKGKLESVIGVQLPNYTVLDKSGDYSSSGEKSVRLKLIFKERDSAILKQKIDDYIRQNLGRRGYKEREWKKNGDNYNFGYVSNCLIISANFNISTGILEFSYGQICHSIESDEPEI